MRRFYFFIFLSLLVFFVACKGYKKSAKKGNPTFLNKRYHDLTARDNSYFHAKMKMIEAKKKLSDAVKDDYTKVLSLNRFGSESEAGATSGDMEEVVKKTSFVVQVHPMSKWVDDSYFLMGQAFYLKRDYASALGTFQYIATELKTKRPTDKKPGTTADSKKKTKKTSSKKSSGSKKKKSSSSKKKSSHSSSTSKNKSSNKGKEEAKKEEKNSKSDEKKADKDKKEKWKFLGFLRHKPIRYQAMVWMADVYIAQKKFDEALSMLKLLEAEEKFPKRLKSQLALRNADFFLKQEDYQNAIAPLEEGIKLTKKKKPKARYSFILAQCYEVNGDNNAALEKYKKVLNYNPTYEMEFNAKLKIAKTAVGADAGSIAEAKRILKSMLHDEKNEEFLDQVYFALAELALKENNEDEAVDYLILAAQKSVNNKKQKAFAFKKLAEIFYNKEKFPPSKNYYDSTLVFLPNEDKEFASIAERRDVLKEAVEKILIIENEDSLQRIAKMTDSEREKFLTSLIKKMKEEQQRMEDSAYYAQQAVLNQSSSGSQQGTSLTSGFYFYNITAKNKGEQEFAKKWGTRSLEDNWRRKSKQLSLAQRNISNTNAPEEKTVRKRYNREEMKKDVPLSTEKMQVSNEALLNAFFDLGNIYREKLKNQKKAIATFEEVEKRFPGNKYEPQIFYNLYLLYAGTDGSKSSYYKSLLESKHSNSDFAKAIANPDYVKGTQLKSKQLNELYSKTYQMYLDNKFSEVISQKMVADSTYKENELQPKFDLLEALAIGKTQDADSFKKALQNISQKHKGNEVAVKADELLKYLEK